MGWTPQSTQFDHDKLQNAVLDYRDNERTCWQRNLHNLHVRLSLEPGEQKNIVAYVLNPGSSTLAEYGALTHTKRSTSTAETMKPQKRRRFLLRGF